MNIELNPYLNGIEIYFDTKPSEHVISILKREQWRWQPRKKCWYNEDTERNAQFADALFCSYLKTRIVNIGIDNYRNNDYQYYLHLLETTITKMKRRYIKVGNLSEYENFTWELRRNEENKKNEHIARIRLEIERKRKERESTKRNEKEEFVLREKREEEKKQALLRREEEKEKALLRREEEKKLSLLYEEGRKREEPIRKRKLEFLNKAKADYDSNENRFWSDYSDLIRFENYEDRSCIFKVMTPDPILNQRLKYSYDDISILIRITYNTDTTKDGYILFGKERHELSNRTILRITREDVPDNVKQKIDQEIQEDMNGLIRKRNKIHLCKSCRKNEVFLDTGFCWDCYRVILDNNKSRCKSCGKHDVYFNTGFCWECYKEKMQSYFD